MVSRQPSRDLLTYTLLGVVILQGFLNLYLLMGNSFNIPTGNATIDPVGIQKAILNVEYDKVGGKENYDLINQASRIQMTQQLPQLKEYIASQGGSTPSVPTDTSGNQGASLDESRIAALLSGAVIEGNKNADILAIEYSDMECPFCVRQYHDTKLQEALNQQYGDSVAFVFKNNRGVNHEGTEAKALGALCAKSLGGDSAYAKFYHAVMNGTTQTGGVYSVDKLVDAAREAGVDATKWQQCLDNKETLAEFNAETAEAQSFNLGGTPGTLIVNIKTGKYTTVEGAYPLATFTQKIDSLK